MTFMNTMKVYIGICALTTSKFLEETGLFTALLGTLIVLSLNLYASWLLLKARNRFKNHRVTTLGQLADLLFGEKAKAYVGLLQVTASTIFLLAY